MYFNYNISKYNLKKLVLDMDGIEIEVVLINKADGEKLTNFIAE